MRWNKCRTLGELESLAENPFGPPRIFVQQKKVSRPGIGRSGQIDVSTRDVEAAADRPHDADGAGGLEAVDMLLDGVADMNRRRPDLPVHSREPLDLIGLHPG